MEEGESSEDEDLANLMLAWYYTGAAGLGRRDTLPSPPWRDTRGPNKAWGKPGWTGMGQAWVDRHGASLGGQAWGKPWWTGLLRLIRLD
jgi:hypothetical protein